MTKLAAAGIRRELARTPGWKRRGARLSRTFVFQDFVAAMKFVNGVARLAERAAHHPVIDIRWNRVKLILTTHDAGGLTRRDFDLARRTAALIGAAR